MKDKLKFNPSILPCYPDGTAYENKKYRVVFYEYNEIREHKHWRAYTLPNGMTVYGSDKEYKTMQQAIDVCQKHYEERQTDD